MTSPMQRALGRDWDLLPPALQHHHQAGDATDIGFLDIDYPRFMQPVLTALRLLGILLNRRGLRVATIVGKSESGNQQNWQRVITYPDGHVVQFNSFWVPAGGNEIIEFVNPVLGLQMAVKVADGRLHYRGVRFVVNFGPVRLGLPQWIALGESGHVL